MQWVKSSRRSTSAGFTLVEVLAVTAILVLLFGFVAALSGVLNKQAAEARAEGEMAALADALETYRASYGDYPWVRPGNGSADMYAALIGMRSPRGDVFPEMRRSFLQLNAFTVGEENEGVWQAIVPESSMRGSRVIALDARYPSHELLDPWDQPYAYAYKRASPTGTEDDRGWQIRGFILMSAGPDGDMGFTLPRSGVLPENWRENEAALDNILFGE